MADVVRVRIAPSPTGKLHIGTARTALFNYLFAKKHDGKFVVRMEDTDKERSTEDFARDILDGLLWLGLPWDEGPEVGGPFAPYNQKDRTGMYQAFLEKLLEEKKAYRCYCTTEELEAERQAQQAAKLPPRYSGKCRRMTKAQVEQFEKEGRPSAVRFAVNPGKVVFDDLIRGKVEFEAELFGDFVIVRTDGSPLFVFSNVIDDHLMEITHVLRGEDHLSNTGKQVLLAEALKTFNPQFGHFPLILNTDRSKMSKRKNPVAISDDYKAKGFLPEALVNFIALLGWSSGDDREMYTLNELVSEFQVERVGKSPSIFDVEKLTWMNGYYIRQLPIGELASRAEQFITNTKIRQAALKDPEFHLQALSLVQDRLKRLDEVESLIEYFYSSPIYEANLLIAKKSTKERTEKALLTAEEAVRSLETITLEETEVALRRAARHQDLTDGEVLWTVRVALSGRDASPGVFELIEVLGKDETLSRLKLAKKKIAE